MNDDILKTKENRSPKCLYEGCTRSTYNGARGLCPNHLVKYSRDVKKGSTSWEQLEKEGKVKRKLTQVEKNANQSRPHLSYKPRKKRVDLDF